MSRVHHLTGITRYVIICGVLLCGLLSHTASAGVDINMLGYGPGTLFSELAQEVGGRTSISLNKLPATHASLTDAALMQPWLWVARPALITDRSGRLTAGMVQWLRRGGFLVIEESLDETALTNLTSSIKVATSGEGAHGWQPIPPDHELMRSFYLLDSLPGCDGQVWRGFHFDGRLAVVVVPYRFLETIRDNGAPLSCVKTAAATDRERGVRVFVNLIMVALATDYKKDQIHLPEILKRLR